MFKKLVIPTMVGLLAVGATTYAGVEGASLLSRDEAPISQSPLETPVSPGGGGEQPGEPPSGGGPGSEEPGARGERPDLAAAAQELGVTEDELKVALGEPGSGPPSTSKTSGSPSSS